MWPVQRILAFVSRYITLAPGDVISTGSGGGNALTGPGDWMRPGQVVRCEAQGIGTLANPVASRQWRSEIPPLPPL
jgi:2-keto-4-pentenoate hydratase/2-oxohepta-3-ene-1,7-dioic acid hydratase in catechol pathway